MGVHWMWLTDTKTSDHRATFPYLLQELCENYDKQPNRFKKELDMATSTGFHGTTFIVDRLHQLNLTTMKWLAPDDFSKEIHLFYCIIIKSKVGILTINWEY